MFDYVLKKMVGTKNQRELRKMQPVVARINERESWAKGLSDEQIREQIRAWQKEVADAGPKEKSAALDRILPDSFALTREGSIRALGMRHFDVQLLGGMALHKGNIAEMKTGEGKTLVATLPCVLNALEGKGVHVVTVNDYVARRDAEWMGRLYRAMGLTVGCVVHGLSDKERQREYAASITYGQNNEFGFDYLRDNMKFRLADYVQRELHYAIVDEVDSILIDEARTPLIISGPSEESTDKYYKINKVIPGLVRDRDFTVDEKARSVVLTDEGVEKVEAKLEVLVIPTNRKNIRSDLQDTVYKTEREKFKAVCDDVEERWKKGQPVLVGTVSIAKSEVLAQLLKKRGVQHDVLNAKQHEREAEIVAQAGRKGRITISTNMAGRGTDILLGGNPEFLAKRDVGPEPTPQDVEGRLVQERVAKAKESGDGKVAPVTQAEVDAELSRVHAEWKTRYGAALER